jgi:hypothetical protein
MTAILLTLRQQGSMANEIEIAIRQPAPSTSESAAFGLETLPLGTTPQSNRPDKSH